MGSVYKANQPAMNRMVAVKILHPKLANRKDLVSRFRREARAMSHLTHPNTVKVLLYGELEDGSLYIVMEYLEGKNLNQMVRTEGPAAGRARAARSSSRSAARSKRRTAPASSTAISSPRTSSSATKGGLQDFPKVLDFGLAKVTEREMRPGSIILTQEGMVFGTPEFMSPEQAQGNARRPQRHLLARGHPLRGAHGQAAVRRADADGVHPAPRHGAPDSARRARPGQNVPAGARASVDRQGAREEARDRYPSAAEFAAALKPFAGAAQGAQRRHAGAAAFAGVPLPARRSAGSTPPLKGRSSGPRPHRGGRRGLPGDGRRARRDRHAVSSLRTAVGISVRAPASCGLVAPDRAKLRVAACPPPNLRAPAAKVAPCARRHPRVRAPVPARAPVAASGRAFGALSIAVLAGLAIALLAAIGGILWWFSHYEADLPSISELKGNYNPPQVTRVLARDGTLLAEIFTERRTVVSIATLPRT